MGTVAEVSKNKSLVFFDGVCNLCSGSVIFIINRDSHSKFLFAPLQSQTAKKFIKTEQPGMDSIVLYEKGKVYRKSTAALKIARKLDGAWWLIYGLIIVPAFIRNFFYDVIANNRYKWFGKKDACMVPTPELKARFLDSN